MLLIFDEKYAILQLTIFYYLRCNVDAIGKLRTVYHNLMKLDYDNKRTRSVSQVDGTVDVETKMPIELFSDFYELQNNQPMSDEQKAFVKDLIEQVWEDEK